jgi:hypothetical protein
MTPFEHQVRERAYYIWEDEGRVFGRADDHWLRAEAELSAGAHPALVVVQAVPATTLAVSPAAVLGETLKAKPSRARTAEAKAATKTVAEPAPKAAKATTKAAASKTAAAAKPVTEKTAASAKAAKPAAAKSATAKAPSKTPKIAARPRTAEAVATVH